jgi:cell division protease FtsH
MNLGSTNLKEQNIATKVEEAIKKVDKEPVKKYSLKVNFNSKNTAGFSGADLEDMIIEATILATRKNKKVVDMDDVE